MRSPTSVHYPEHRATCGARPWRDRIRAAGAAAAPRTDAPVLSRGTHRTRVSEMRLIAMCVAAQRPDIPGTVERQARRAATEREGIGRRVRSGTG